MHILCMLEGTFLLGLAHILVLGHTMKSKGQDTPSREVTDFSLRATLKVKNLFPVNSPSFLRDRNAKEASWYLQNSLPFKYFNPGLAEPGYALPLQTV